MESPCKGCEREGLDKNECIGQCADIKKFQRELDVSPISVDSGIVKSYLNGAVRKGPKPFCL